MGWRGTVEHTDGQVIHRWLQPAARYPQPVKSFWCSRASRRKLELMADPQPITWQELLDYQLRVVSRRQALDHGVSTKVASTRTRSGHWQRLHRGTYATFSGAPPREARLWAALLRAGPGAVLSHETAAEVHGLTDKPGKIIHITVPIARDPARSGSISGVVIHRSRNVTSQRLPPWQLPRTPVAETVLDLVNASKTFDDAYSWLSRATGRQLASAEVIREALAARKRMRWRGWLADALDDVTEGVMFPLERRYVRDVERAHGLPSARRQARRDLTSGIRYLDNFYDRYRLCVELDGQSSHPPEQKWRDADRDNDNVFLDDVQTVRLGMRDVTVRRCAQAVRLATVLMRRGWDGVGLHPCGADCRVGRQLLAGIGGGAADAAVKLAQELRIVVRSHGDGPPALRLPGSPGGVAGDGGIGVLGGVGHVSRHPVRVPGGIGVGRINERRTTDVAGRPGLGPRRPAREEPGDRAHDERRRDDAEPGGLGQAPVLGGGC